ncbi:hypothetical protein BC628DRAFT_81042 [Trametes gibbosa]|nr:hypothetical protein BC628DRAFT_81042 [Trametes gibbosa]
MNNRRTIPQTQVRRTLRLLMINLATSGHFDHTTSGNLTATAHGPSRHSLNIVGLTSGLLAAFSCDLLRPRCNGVVDLYARCTLRLPSYNSVHAGISSVRLGTAGSQYTNEPPFRDHARDAEDLVSSQVQVQATAPSQYNSDGPCIDPAELAMPIVQRLTHLEDIMLCDYFYCPMSKVEWSARCYWIILTTLSSSRFQVLRLASP